jgi:L-fuculose-phosphate aldolase
MENIETIKKQMIAVAKALHGKNMLAAADGNISYRISDDEIFITPSGKPKALVKPDDIAVINLKNEILSGTPSSERLMHLAVYENCPQARCVIHAHPATAIAWSIARPDLTELPSGCLSELILAAGRVPIAPYARPGTKTMGDVLKPFLPASRIIILARHGAITWGEDLQEALNGMERLEHTATILLHATQLGGITFLPEEEIVELHAMRKIIGERIL